MFSSDHNIAELVQLVHETKAYVQRRMELARYDLTGKLIAIFSALCLSIAILIVMAVAFLFLSFSLVQALATAWHNEAAAYLVVGLAYVLVGGIIYLFRKPLVYNPMANFIGKLFLDDHQSHREEDL